MNEGLMLMQRRRFLAHVAWLPLGLWLAGRRSPDRPAYPLPPEPWSMGPEALARWHRAPRRPVADSDDPQVHACLVAMRSSQRVRFRYLGGSTPGAGREVSPGLLFTAEGFPGVYFSGYCHTRCAERTFLVARMLRPAGSLPLANAVKSSVS
jgi:hypothetical protein